MYSLENEIKCFPHQKDVRNGNIPSSKNDEFEETIALSRSTKYPGPNFVHAPENKPKPMATSNHLFQTTYATPPHH